MINSFEESHVMTPLGGPLPIRSMPPVTQSMIKCLASASNSAWFHDRGIESRLGVDGQWGAQFNSRNQIPLCRRCSPALRWLSVSDERVRFFHRDQNIDPSSLQMWIMKHSQPPQCKHLGAFWHFQRVDATERARVMSLPQQPHACCFVESCKHHALPFLN